MTPTDETLGALVADVAEAIAQQAGLVVELRVAELSRDAQTFGRDAAPIALGLPFVALGYVFACVAVALALAPWLSTAGGLGLVAFANLLAGGLAVRRSLAAWSSRSPLSEASHARN
jgi:hypothetical protein